MAIGLESKDCEVKTERGNHNRPILSLSSEEIEPLVSRNQKPEKMMIKLSIIEMGNHRVIME